MPLPEPLDPSALTGKAARAAFEAKRLGFCVAGALEVGIGESSHVLEDSLPSGDHLQGLERPTKSFLGSVEGECVNGIISRRFLAVDRVSFAADLGDVVFSQLGEQPQKPCTQALVQVLAAPEIEDQLHRADHSGKDGYVSAPALVAGRQSGNHTGPAHQNAEIQQPVQSHEECLPIFVIPHVAQQRYPEPISLAQCYSGLFQSVGTVGSISVSGRRLRSFSSCTSGGLFPGGGFSSCRRAGCGGGGGCGSFSSDAHCGVSPMRGLQSFVRLVASRLGRVMTAGPLFNRSAGGWVLQSVAVGCAPSTGHARWSGVPALMKPPDG